MSSYEDILQQLMNHVRECPPCREFGDAMCAFSIKLFADLSDDDLEKLADAIVKAKLNEREEEIFDEIAANFWKTGKDKLSTSLFLDHVKECIFCEKFVFETGNPDDRCEIGRNL